MYKKLLVALDGSRSADLALSQAIGLAKSTGAHVDAVFVVDSSEVLLDGGYTDPSRIIEAMTEGGRATLQAAARRLQDEGVPHATHLLEKPVAPGQIATTIVAQADAHDSDLIVAGTHGRRGLRRLVMGSVAEGIVRATFRPVLLIRSETED